MKKFYILLVVAILISPVLSACSDAPKATQEDIKSSEVMLSIADTKPQEIEDAQNIQLGLNLNLLKELSKKNKNIFYSSFSINQALTMAYFGADGETQSEIQNVLGYSNLTMEDVAAYQKYLLKNYKDSGDTEFYTANSMWIDDELPVKESYIYTMFDSFDAEVSNIDLQDDKAYKKVNSWIDKKTNGMIEKLFEEPFSGAIRLILMNAIYFDGSWTNPFDEHATRQQDFNGAGGVSTVDMMYSGEDVQGYANDDYTSVSLPYGDDERFSMVLVLPNGDINNFIQGLSQSSLNDMLTTFERKSSPTVMMPKFEMEEKLILNDTLKALGMPTAFTGAADFSEISDVTLAIDEVIHKAKIKVDETGTEAAAVTAITMKETAMEIGEPFRFIADKPFLFFIMDTEDDTVLFTGAIYDLD